MKSLLALAIFLPLILCQHPVPIPSVNSTEFEGLWYVVWLYASYIDDDFEASCYTWNVETNVAGANIDETIYVHGYERSNTIAVTFGSPDSIWKGNDGTLYWIAADPVSFSWGAVGVSAGTQPSASILSRNPTLSSTIIAAQILALKAEGFNINATNSIYINSTNCS